MFWSAFAAEADVCTQYIRPRSYYYTCRSGNEAPRPQYLHSHICDASYMEIRGIYMEFLVMYGHCRCLGPEPIAPAVDWLRIRSVEAALVNIYAARPLVWIEQVAKGVLPQSELRVYP